MRTVNKFSKIFTLAIIFILTILCCLSPFFLQQEVIAIQKTFYFLYYNHSEHNEVAVSLSSTIQSYGGSGYVLHYKKNYYVLYSGYYQKDDAITVKNKLTNYGLRCSLLEVQCENAPLNKQSFNNLSTFLSNVLSLSSIAYDAANNLDDSSITQKEAQTIMDTLHTQWTKLTEYCILPEFCHQIAAMCYDYRIGTQYSKQFRTIQLMALQLFIDCCVNS